MSKNSPQTSLEYRNPLGTRYASPAMSRLFSEKHRAVIWRQLWTYLAEEQRKLGLPIKASQIQAMKKAMENVDLQKVRRYEIELKHDVMSHIKAFGDDAPEAEPIIHLGATSAFVTDNADVLILRDAGILVQSKVLKILDLLAGHIRKTKDLICSGFTHFQPAQPTTLGKRFSLWAQDLLWDAEEIENTLKRLLPLGCKGATGTQASFMVLFNGDFKKVEALDRALCKRMGFERPVAVSGQTLSRKVDCWFLNALANLGSSLSKMSYDLRLLQHLGEVREPFGKKQVGSSAMAYKRNPILAERISGLSRFLINLSTNGTWTHAVQWMERSLDDSSNRRIVLAEAFLAADSICELAIRILGDLEINRDQIRKHLEENAAHFETEAEMMKGTLAGGSRQDLHESIRRATAGKKSHRLNSSGDVFAGAAVQQTENFLEAILLPYLQKNRGLLKKSAAAVGSAAI